ncbi:MAG: UDP-N-acetylmuramoyl-L-alanyl-D-glutamate--2,6-diaminopimelate ligase [Ignavibacteria bacterium]|nr:UDP-N-acetylmuramoyl-L-alanyl-D-glutamate--2,6-diaminopimelate ligase [Ignavibacteria bacterium]
MEIIVKGRDFEIESLSYNSKNISDNSIFFSVTGLKEDGSRYIPDSINKGAKAVISDSDKCSIYKDICKNQNIWLIKAKNIRKLMAEISAAFFGFPAKKLKCVAITGTNGKTTLTYLIKHFLEANGIKCGLIGTIDYYTGITSRSAELTTPDSIEIQMLMSEMVASGLEYCVMETSSIALELDRVHGIEFICGVFTNLTSEHLDIHKNMENYLYAKKILFNNLGGNAVAVSNCDDEYGIRILEDTKSRKIFYSIGKDCDYRVVNERLSLNGTEFDLINENVSYNIKSNLAGRFNIYNITAALSCINELGFDITKSIESLNTFKGVNGRFNTIKLSNEAYAVIDYSHTSDSLKNAILAAKEIIKTDGSKSKVITIFGCGGNKDRTKRPVMGKYAAEYSDYAVVTSDNPRFEEPMDIISEILAGIDSKFKNYEVEENREKAIKKGIEISGKGDIILICGKGHETYQEIKGVKYHFNDREIVDKYKNLKQNT